MSIDPREIQIRKSLVTPKRSVTVTFDHTEGVLTEPVYEVAREARQMFPESVSNCILLRAGVWQLQPLNDWSQNHESEVGQSFVIRLADWSAAPSLTELPHFRDPTELIGTTSSPDVAVNGDYFLTRRVSAGGNWDDALANPDVPPPITAANHYPLRLMGRSFETHTGMTGYCIKAWLPGGPLMVKDAIIGFKFGGALRTEGYGLFFLSLGGDGQATLYEKIGGVWVEQGRWRYLAPAEAPGGGFGMWILPFFPAGIEFDTYTGGGNEDYFKTLTDRSLDLLSGVNATQSAQQSFIFRASRGGLGLTGSGDPFGVTGNGQVELYIRQETRPYVQIARLSYHEVSGEIIDRPAVLPPYAASDEHILRLIPKGNHVAFGADVRTNVSQELIDADSDIILIPDTESEVWRGVTTERAGWLPPGGRNAIKAKFLLSSDADTSGNTWWTPYIRGYTIKRNHHIQSHAPGAKTGGTITGISTSGPSYDPEQETAFVEIEDLTNALAFLRSRGKASIRVATTYDEAGTESTETAILFEGYTGRVTASLQGKDGMVYPSAQWRTLGIECEGKWQRLTERFFHSRMDFGLASTAPDATAADGMGSILGWKATTIIRYLLSLCGFDEATQLDIPDIDLRVFVRGDQQPDGITALMPGTPVAGYLLMLCRDFINGFLYWEPNAGTTGMWRLKQPPTGEESPVWTFTLDQPAAGPKLAHQAVAYGASRSPILGPEEFSTWVVPAENNCITVSGGWDQKTKERFQQSIVNEESFNAPAHPATADATNLDYISGGVVPIEYVDVGLDSQEAVDWIARRIFNLACRGRKFISFSAEVVLVDRATPEPTIFSLHPVTPLRPGDMIDIVDQDGNTVRHILHQCSPNFEYQGVMIATYLAELFRPDTTFAAVTDMGLEKEVLKRESRRSLGAQPYAPNVLSPQSKRSSLSPEILAMPVKAADPIRVGSTWTFMFGESRFGGPDEFG